MSLEHINPEQPELNRVARIGGIALPLGSMTLQELEAINGHVSERLESVQRDWLTVSAYLDKHLEA